MPAKQGHAIAQYYLGDRETGKDRVVNQGWLLAAAEQGYIEAQMSLKTYYEFKDDVKKSAKWLEKAAEQGHARAQFIMGDWRRLGKSIEKNEEEAVKWYIQSAEQGYADAQCNLAYCYDNGVGVEKDKTRAREWYEKSAAQNEPGALYTLGVYYETGEGVDQDHDKAMRLYAQAAALGDALAQQALRELEASKAAENVKPKPPSSTASDSPAVKKEKKKKKKKKKKEKSEPTNAASASAQPQATGESDSKEEKGAPAASGDADLAARALRHVSAQPPAGGVHDVRAVSEASVKSFEQAQGSPKVNPEDNPHKEKSLEVEAEKLRNEKAEAERRAEESAQETQRLRNEVEALKAANKQSKSARAEVKTLRGKNADVEQKAAESAKEIQVLHERIKVLEGIKQQSKSLSTEIAGLRQEVEATKQKSQKYAQEAQRLRDAVSTANKQLKSARAEAEVLRREKAVVEERAKSSTQEAWRLHEQIKVLKSAKQRLNSALEKAEAFRQEKIAAAQRVIESTEQIQQLQEQIKALEGAKQQLEVAHAEVVEKLRGENAAAEQKAIEYAQETQWLRDEVETLTAAKQQLESRLVATNNWWHAKLTTEVNKLLALVQSYQRQVQGLESKGTQAPREDIKADFQVLINDIDAGKLDFFISPERTRDIPKEQLDETKEKLADLKARLRAARVVANLEQLKQLFGTRRMACNFEVISEASLWEFFIPELAYQDQSFLTIRRYALVVLYQYVSALSNDGEQIEQKHQNNDDDYFSKFKHLTLAVMAYGNRLRFPEQYSGGAFLWEDGLERFGLFMGYYHEQISIFYGKMLLQLLVDKICGKEFDDFLLEEPVEDQVQEARLTKLYHQMQGLISEVNKYQQTADCHQLKQLFGNLRFGRHFFLVPKYAIEIFIPELPYQHPAWPQIREYILERLVEVVNPLPDDADETSPQVKAIDFFVKFTQVVLGAIAYGNHWKNPQVMEGKPYLDQVIMTGLVCQNVSVTMRKLQSIVEKLWTLRQLEMI